MNDKQLRERVKQKFDGLCAFCGHHLGKGWHVWDIEPITTVVTSDGGLDKINTEEDNLMPCCKSCGSLRIREGDAKMSIERFRIEVQRSFEFLRGGGITASSYGRSVRFGLLIETGKEVEFYFEKMERQNLAKL